MIEQGSFRGILFSPLFQLSFLAAGLLVFWNLGAYSFWDDEAIDGLIARSIIQNGRADALIDHNLLGYRDGALLHNLKIEGQPPFCAWVAIPCFAFFGQTSLAGRLLPALTGLATAYLMLLWVFQAFKEPLMRILFSAALLLNVSFFLFSRQLHYYGPSMFFSVLIAYLWARPGISIARLWGIGFGLFCLNLSNYLSGFLVTIILTVDYFLFKSRQQPLQIRQILPVFIPILFSGALIYLDWNPFRTVLGSKLVANTLEDKSTLFFWGLRDLNQCEFISGVTIMAWLGVLIRIRDSWPWRLTCALCLFFVGVCLFSTQPVQATSAFDIRYLVPMLPFLIFVSSFVIFYFLKSKPLIALVAGIIILGTNLTHRAFPFSGDRFCAMGGYLQELVSPIPEPFSPAIAWLQKNAPKKSSVWVLPDYMAYPLMFHAPDATYAWQFSPEKRQNPAYQSLPEIHFKGLTPPNFILVFGPSVQQIRQLIEQWSMEGLRYQEVARLMTFWKDLYRPELFWRTFKPIENFDPHTEAIYIFQRQP